MSKVLGGNMWESDIPDRYCLIVKHQQNKVPEIYVCVGENSEDIPEICIWKQYQNISSGISQIGTHGSTLVDAIKTSFNGMKTVCDANWAISKRYPIDTIGPNSGTRMVEMITGKDPKHVYTQTQTRSQTQASNSDFKTVTLQCVLSIFDFTSEHARRMYSILDLESIIARCVLT